MKNQRKNNYFLRAFAAFLVANIIFIDLFFLSYSVSYANYQIIKRNNNEIEDSIAYVDKLLNFSICDSNLLIQASTKLDVIGSKLGLLEERFGKKDSRVLEQKAFYSELEYKHFQLIKKLNENCNGNFITLLFFYSNEGGLEDRSNSMAFILGPFKNKNPEKIMIYSFDYNLKYQIISDLKDYYNISDVPVVIVNEKNKVYVNHIDDLNNFNK